MNTEQHTIQPDLSSKLPGLASNLESTKSFLSLVRTSSATKSASSQRLDSFDPECLSPLAIPTFNSSSASKAQDSSQKSHLGHKLKVKVYNYFQDKNDNTPYYPVSEEETPGYSISTSADTPQLIQSALRRQESEGTIVRQSSRNDIISQASEENSGNVSQEVSEINNNTLSEPRLTHTELINGAQDAMNINTIPISSDNQGNNTNQAAQGQSADSNFIESLEFILEKTPIITIFMSLISLALISGIAISVIDGKDTHTFLFIVLYVFLMYLLIEKIFKMFRACRTTSPTITLLLQTEAFYNVLDGIAFIVVALIIDLKLSEVLASFNIGLYSLIAVFSVYCACARLSFKEKARGVIKRSLYIAQLLVLMYKVDDNLSLSWRYVLCSGWIVLGSLLIKLATSMARIVKAFSGLNILSAISKSAKVIGMMGLTLIGVDLIVLMMILNESCKLLDMEKSDMEDLQLWLTISQYLNACLLFFTTITGADLLEFILSAAEHFNPFEEVIVKPKQLVMAIKETYVLRMSTTYYRIVEKGEVEQREAAKHCHKDGCEGAQIKKEEGFEDNTCYICCGNNANGVVLDCGHGGACYECLTDYIKRKDECMECRKKVNSILKVDSEIENGKLFKGSEVWSIERK